jgi:hypothetical protein
MTTEQGAKADETDLWLGVLAIRDPRHSQTRAHGRRGARQRVERGKVRLKRRANGAACCALGVGGGEHTRQTDDVRAHGAVGFVLEDDRVVGGHPFSPFDGLIPASLRILLAKPVPASFLVCTERVTILFVAGFQNCL